VIIWLTKRDIVIAN